MGNTQVCKCVEKQMSAKCDPAFHKALEEIELIFELTPEAVHRLDQLLQGADKSRYLERQEEMLTEAQLAVTATVAESWAAFDEHTGRDLSEAECRELMNDYATALRKWMPTFCMRVFKYRASAIELSVMAISGQPAKIEINSHFLEKNQQAGRIARECCHEILAPKELHNLFNTLVQRSFSTGGLQSPSSTHIQKHVFCPLLGAGNLAAAFHA
jgi:hypothetical protein